MVNESASKIEQDNATYMILVTKDNRQGNLEGLSSLSYTSINAYCTTVLGYRRDQLRVASRFGIRYCAIGLFQIVILISILALPCCWGVFVSILQRVSNTWGMENSTWIFWGPQHPRTRINTRNTIISFDKLPWAHFHSESNALEKVNSSA